MICSIDQGNFRIIINTHYYFFGDCLLIQIRKYLLIRKLVSPNQSAVCVGTDMTFPLVNPLNGLLHTRLGSGRAGYFTARPTYRNPIGM